MFFERTKGKERGISLIGSSLHDGIFEEKAVLLRQV
jgi:hypothetical protein